MAWAAVMVWGQQWCTQTQPCKKINPNRTFFILQNKIMQFSKTVFVAARSFVKIHSPLPSKLINTK
jgi:hypothetical protein